MMQLQQAGFDALRPGRTFADAEADVSDTFKTLGVGDLQRHHTGHGIGLEGHEWPFIDKGSTDVVIEENMVLSVEPGIVRPWTGGVSSLGYGRDPGEWGGAVDVLPARPGEHDRGA